MPSNDLSNVPTGMENDPYADEQIIDQTATGSGTNRPETVNPSGIEKPVAGQETPMDDLANALAYAIDGSGTGVAGAPPVAPVEGEPQKVKTEGTTGASLADEERSLPL